jgi:RNA polymerase sigma-32 factor
MAAVSEGEVMTRNDLVLSAMPRAERYARILAHKWRHWGVDPDDVVNEAAEALLEAAKYFRREDGVTFWTYAMHGVRRRCGEYVHRYRFAAHQPRTKRPTQRDHNRVRNATHVAIARTGEKPSAEEVAAEVGVAAADVEKIWNAGRLRDCAIAHHDDVRTPGGAWVAASDGASPFDHAAQNEERQRLMEALGTVLPKLSPRAADIIRRRYLSEDPPHQIELAMEYGVSRQSVQQMEALAIEKIRKAMGVAS